MDVKQYIESGILELYVAGALSEKENSKIHAMMLPYPEVLDEVSKIESAIISLTAAASPSNPAHFLPSIKSKFRLEDHPKVKPLHKTRFSWATYSGWAAAIIVGFTLLWSIHEMSSIKDQIQVVETNNKLLEEQMKEANSDLVEADKLISILRDEDIITVPLTGQEVYPEAYARVYWNKDANNIYLDVEGLPKPPKGKVYQVWSLKLSPLVATSLGTIDSFTTDDNKIFSIPNPNDSDAFGITLEPAGGSETPTMGQLYTIGVVESNS